MKLKKADKITWLMQQSDLSYSDIVKFSTIVRTGEFSIKKLAKRFGISIAMAQYLIRELDK